MMVPSGFRAFGVALFVAIIAAGASAEEPKELLGQPGVALSKYTAESLQKLHEAGIVCIEVPVCRIMAQPKAEWEETCRQLVADAQQAGITLWSAHLPYDKTCDLSQTDPAEQEKTLATLHDALELCALLKVQKAVIHASANNVSDARRPAALGVAKKILRQVTPEYAQRGIQLALEELPGKRLGNTSDEILSLIDGIDGLGVCLDTNHLGDREKPEDFARKVGPHIVTLHVADFDGVGGCRHWMPGDGVVDFAAVAAALRQIHYTGPFVYETGAHKDGTPIQPDEYIEFWKKL